MSSLLVVRPLPPTAIVGSSGITAPGNLLTPDPKEAALVAAGGGSITLDLGTVVQVDTAFVGYHTATAATWAMGGNDGTPGNGIPASLTVAAVSPLNPTGTADLPRHACVRSAVVRSSRYWQFQFGAQAGGYLVGCIALGLAFQPSLGHEYGSGRQVGDTSSVSRLRGGGFGIDPGVTFTGWRWTMGDLTDDEVAQLYAIQRRTGTAKTVLVVEDPDPTPGLNERIHWGLMQKLEPYERLAPGATRWAMTIDDWA